MTIQDINLIAVWFEAGEYWWALMQLTFTVASHALSALYIRGVKGWAKKSMFNTETGKTQSHFVFTQTNRCYHQILTFLGVGRAFYAIKSFKHWTEEEQELDKEFHLLKLWVIIYIYVYMYTYTYIFFFFNIE
ncbi:hypothetical protein RFI_09957 [Reticulomyxa filosa]|uniref:Uncharacterized protein n=1 Tax=Reticulomyxa filosa TaxID=46433 RepID=X6NLK9_RETFI|nr:hypothetical protein RFI_09957 [Reticulomyxa filosa]|eukprot:ETO27175.1 hypothetical protein RFI_09957 [Reticulomyxa filosa]